MATYKIVKTMTTGYSLFNGNNPVRKHRRDAAITAFERMILDAIESLALKDRPIALRVHKTLQALRNDKHFLGAKMTIGYYEVSIKRVA